MCHLGCIVFGAANLSEKEVQGKRVIEVGAYDVNGSLRPVIESMKPEEYIGVDIEMGPGVDMIVKGEDLVKTFGKESFDLVIATELLEHTKNWREVISNLKDICKKDGILLITTCAIGFKYHSYPDDFWRYEIKDFKKIFSDFEILKTEKAKNSASVYLKARKPENFRENDLTEHKLYSIVVGRRIKDHQKGDLKRWRYRRMILREKVKDWFFETAGKVIPRGK